jgi:hypothetical protein
MSDTKREFDKKMASGLWRALRIVVEHFHPKLSRTANVDFLGFARVTIDASAVLPGLILTLTGIQVKVLKGNARIDFKQEKNETSGKWFDLFYARTAELRAVLTQRIFKDAGVIAALEACTQLPKPGQVQGADAPASDDPFASA